MSLKISVTLKRAYSKGVEVRAILKRVYNADRVIKPLSVTANGVYREKDVGYSPVTVEVPVPKVKPFTFTENGVYNVEDGEINGANPVTVNVQIPINPLEVTKNGTYTAKEGEAFNPVTVNIERSIKKYIEAGGTFYYDAIEDFRPLLEYSDTENVTNGSNFFFRCAKLKYLPMLDFRKLTRTYYMFKGCSVLEETPLFDLSNNGDFQGMFSGCTSLKVVPAYDMRSGWTASNMVGACLALEEIWVRNINCDLQVGSGDSFGHLIKVECLIHLIYELRYNKAKRILTIGNVNLEKLANVYVRTIDITDEMRAEDDLIDEKLPFEVCESTDEGAMWIVDYVLLKNWELR